MSRKKRFTKLKITIIIFCGATILGVSAALGYYNKQHSKNATNSQTQENTDTLKAQTSPQSNQSLDEAAQTAQETQATQATQAAQTETTKPAETTAETSSKKLTSDKAVEIINNIVVKNSSNTKAAFDHIQKRDGNDYYVIRLYQSLSDHSATLGWFYVQVDTGKAFAWDLTDDKLTPIN